MTPRARVSSSGPSMPAAGKVFDPTGVVCECERTPGRRSVDPAFVSVGAGRPQLSWFEDHVDTTQVRLRSGDGGGVRRRWCRDRRPGAGAAPSAWRRIGVVEGGLEMLHQTSAPGGVLAHDLCFDPADLGQRVPFGVVMQIGGAGGAPAASVPVDVSGHGEQLEQRFDAATSQSGGCFERDDGVGLGVEGVEEGGDMCRVGNPGSREVLPETFVVLCWEEDGHGVVERTTGPSDLLVVRHGAGW
jgi:hypothetical protein